MKFNNIDKEKIYSEVANINRKGLVSEEESLDIIHAIVGMREDGICVNFDGIDNKIRNDIHRMLPSALLNREQEKRAFALLVFYLLGSHYTQKNFNCQFAGDFLNRYMNNSILVSPHSIKNEDAWFKNIKITSNKKYGDWRYEDSVYSKGEFFINECSDSDYIGKRNNIGIAIGDIHCVMAFNNNYEFSYEVTPFTINESSYGVEDATGNVIVLGLKAGYFSYMVSEKDNVKSVTIIEKDKDLIKLFEDNILPQFNHIEKIKIINENPISYMNNSRNWEDVDYVWCDTYVKGEFGIEDYQSFKQIEVNSKLKFGYFDEFTILYEIKEYISCELASQVMCDDDMEDDDDFQGFGDETDYLDTDSTNMSYVAKKIENISLKEDSDVVKLLTSINLRKILSE